MSEVTRIIDQLNRAFEGGAWHGPSVKELLSGVTADKAAAQPVTGAHSIWELTLHIAAWESAALRRLNGDAANLSDDEDWPAVNDRSSDAWQRTIASLERGHLKLAERISRLSDSDLNATATGQSTSVYFLLHGVIQHSLYHAGQIALLKKA
ncbi:MAG TPA: DinB family protein [Blastocatellia bacterium]|nr:DinB family protein [Blastocatellia bacterium]